MNFTYRNHHPRTLPPTLTLPLNPGPTYIRSIFLPFGNHELIALYTRLPPTALPPSQFHHYFKQSSSFFLLGVFLPLFFFFFYFFFFFCIFICSTNFTYKFLYLTDSTSHLITPFVNKRLTKSNKSPFEYYFLKSTRPSGAQDRWASTSIWLVTDNRSLSLSFRF
jgi:hypothetical protein